MTFETSNSYGTSSYDENSESSRMQALDESPRRRRRGINFINPNYVNQSAVPTSLSRIKKRLTFFVASKYLEFAVQYSF
jgi:hypothetical protein